KGTMDIKKFIARKGIVFERDYIQTGYDRYMRCFYPVSYPKRVAFGQWLYEAFTFGDIDFSIYIKPCEKTKVLKELNTKLSQFISDFRREKARDNIDKADMLEIAT